MRSVLKTHVDPAGGPRPGIPVTRVETICARGEERELTAHAESPINSTAMASVLETVDSVRGRRAVDANLRPCFICTTVATATASCKRHRRGVSLESRSMVSIREV